MKTLPPADLAALIEPPAGSPMRSRDFVFGVATSAYQIEGATHDDGRVPSIWDRFCRQPGAVLGGDTAEVACDHYHRWEEDVELIASLGVDAYRFSIAWPRVMNEAGRPNPRGLDFYKRLLDRLAERGVHAFVTLYHWDLPQHLEDRGGWLQRDTAQRFADYADLTSRALAGHGVASWATFNEPWCSAWFGYGTGEHAPGHRDPRQAMRAMHHLLLAHGLALPALRANDASAPVGIVANVAPVSAARDTAADREAAVLRDAHQNGWVLDPLLAGRYPEALFRLWPGVQPPVQGDDMAVISRPIDFLGLNYYTRAVVAADGANGFREVSLPGVERTTMGWEVSPQGLQDILETLHRRYPDLPPIHITENGLSSADALRDGEIDDVQRQSYFKRHFDACSRAMAGGVDVRGYFAWSLLDNFEWAFGYDRRFGLVHVDFATQRRTPKRSALALAAFLHERAASAGSARGPRR